MDSDEQYLHLPPELRQILLLGAKQPVFPDAGDYFNSILTAAGACGPVHQASIQPPLPRNMNASSSANNGGFCSSQGRWPRQETLTLLEIRARLDRQFRQAAQKAPLWDEVARIMAEEYGYQRSGRKCREKLENLYKYYKKTKEGKIGRQDGKRYRFFRQLEELYCPSAAAVSVAGVQSATPGTTHPRYPETAAISNRLSLLENLDGLSFSTSAESSGEEGEAEAVERSGSYRKIKSGSFMIAALVDAQMKRLVEIQKAWFEKMLRSFERMEQERLQREENWRKEEAARQERQRLLLASERAWVEAREAALFKALEKMIRPEMMASVPLPPAESEEMECDLSRAMGLH